MDGYRLSSDSDGAEGFLSFDEYEAAWVKRSLVTNFALYIVLFDSFG